MNFTIHVYMIKCPFKMQLTGHLIHIRNHQIKSSLVLYPLRVTKADQKTQTEVRYR